MTQCNRTAPVFRMHDAHNRNTGTLLQQRSMRTKIIFFPLLGMSVRLVNDQKNNFNLYLNDFLKYVWETDIAQHAV